MMPERMSKKKHMAFRAPELLYSWGEERLCQWPILLTHKGYPCLNDFPHLFEELQEERATTSVLDVRKMSVKWMVRLTHMLIIAAGFKL